MEIAGSDRRGAQKQKCLGDVEQIFRTVRLRSIQDVGGSRGDVPKLRAAGVVVAEPGASERYLPRFGGAMCLLFWSSTGAGRRTGVCLSWR
jgi:hypothetical protein